MAPRKKGNSYITSIVWLMVLGAWGGTVVGDIGRMDAP